MTGSGTWKTEAFTKNDNFLLDQHDLPLRAGLALRVGNEQDVGLSDANPLLPTAAGVAVGVKSSEVGFYYPENDEKESRKLSDKKDNPIHSN
ncbi:hypothetical protein ACPUEN_00470 [Algoriphagus yeomjeoni]|uniref:hypothetical protein n=1 Tax=Algoriphagus yeomjeoni TaxID=291403 RepID=UPI003CE5AF99